MLSRNEFSPLRALLLAFAALLALAGSAAADTYLRVPPGETLAWSTVVAKNNCLVTDDVYAKMPPINQPDGYNYIGNQKYAIGYKEGTHGYISDIQFGFEYHLWPGILTQHTPFNPALDDHLVGWVNTYYPVLSNVSKCIIDWFPTMPPFDASVVSASELDGGNDFSYVASFRTAPKTAAEFTASMQRWGQLDCATFNHAGGSAGAKYGLFTEVDWNGRPLVSGKGQNDVGTSFYIDHIFINVLVKMTVTGSSVAPALATQGTKTVPMLWLKTQTYSNTGFDLKDLKVDFTGTCVAADLSMLSLYRDKNENGRLDTGDILTGTTAVTAKTGVKINATKLIDNVPQNSRWILAVDLADNATPNNTVGMSIADQTYLTPFYAVDGIASNADRTNAYTQDTVNPNPLWPIATAAGALKILKVATLTSAFTAPAAGLTKVIGESFTVTLDVANEANCGTAENVLPSAPALSTANAAITSSVPSPVTINPGSSAAFSWTYIAAQPVPALTFTALGAGTDTSSGRSVQSANAVSNAMALTNVSAPALQLTLTASPTPLSSNDQELTVLATIRNWGTGAANNAGIYDLADNLWHLAETTPDGAAVNQTTGALALQNIPAGDTATWTFTYLTAQKGALTFSARAKATGAVDVDASSNPVTIRGVANVVNTSVSPSPAAPGRNASFTVSYTVRNDGGARALDVMPAPLTPEEEPSSGGTPDPVVTFGPVPSRYDLAPGESGTFNWTVNSKNGTTLGTYRFSGSASYKDEFTLEEKTTAVLVGSYFTVLNQVTPLANAATAGVVRKLITYSDNSNYYVISGLATSNTLYKFGTNGSLVWSHDLTAHDGISVPGDVFSVTTEGGFNVIWVGASNGYVYAIKDTGTAPAGWFGPEIVNSWCSTGDGTGVTTGPIVWNGYIYCASGPRLAKRSVVDGSIPPGWTDYQASNTITTSPSMDNNYIYFGCADQRLYCINALSGVLQSRSNTQGAAVTGEPFIYGNKIFSTAAAKLLVFNSSTDLTNLTVKTYAGTLSDPWVGLGADFVWFTNTGTNLYKINYNTLATTATYTIANNALYAPIELFGIVYLCGADTRAAPNNVGYVHVRKKTDGTTISGIWPYQSASAQQFRSPVAIDIWNDVFLAGNDGNRVFVFGLPTF